jgi:hypothetical protein
MTLDAEGNLPPCLVSCPELTRRLKVGKGDTCAIRLAFKGDAIVVNAPQLKSGRAIQVTSGPIAGHTFNSMSAAMVAATAGQRRELGLGTSGKGLPSSGWDFWSPAPRKRASA